MLSYLAVNALALALVIASAAAWAAWCEARPRGVTVGKRLLRLLPVVPSGKPAHDRLARTVVVRALYQGS
jgi:hypothetical protein